MVSQGIEMETILALFCETERIYGRDYGDGRSLEASYVRSLVLASTDGTFLQ